MRKLALITLLLVLCATPVLAAEGQATSEQTKQWNQVVMKALEDKYGEDKAYKNDYVTIGEWTVIDIDTSQVKQDAEAQIAKIEEEIAPLKSEAVELQDKLNYFNTLAAEIRDEAYKAEVEKIIQDTEQALSAKQDEIAAKEEEINAIKEKEYPEQIAVSHADIKFGGKVLGTLTYHDKFFINPETNELIDAAEAQGYKEVSEFMAKQPTVSRTKFHYESLGLFFIVLGLGGWYFLMRKF